MEEMSNNTNYYGKWIKGMFGLWESDSSHRARESRV